MCHFSLIFGHFILILCHHLIGDYEIGRIKDGVWVCQSQRDIFNVSKISTDTHVIGQIVRCVLDNVQWTLSISKNFAKDTARSLGNKVIQPNHANPPS